MDKDKVKFIAIIAGCAILLIAAIAVIISEGVFGIPVTESIAAWIPPPEPKPKPIPIPFPIFPPCIPGL